MHLVIVKNYTGKNTWCSSIHNVYSNYLLQKKNLPCDRDKPLAFSQEGLKSNWYSRPWRHFHEGKQNGDNDA